MKHVTQYGIRFFISRIVVNSGKKKTGFCFFLLCFPLNCVPALLQRGPFARGSFVRLCREGK